MAHLATVGSHAVNGVAELHTELLKQTVLRDFHEIAPEKFHNITNGVTPRRWMALSNPGLAELITEAIGDDWICRLEEEIPQARALCRETRNSGSAGGRSSRPTRQTLAGLIRERTGVAVNPESLFDIQVKRIHEYKRQHLNILHVITLYRRLKENPALDAPPRTVIFGGKAAPGYFMAKLIIKLINAVAEVVNSDPAIADRLKVVFFPDFNVKNGQRIYPAADLSEQISTGRQGGLRDGEHEVLHERRPHHRHPGRRQRGDPRSRWGRRTSSSLASTAPEVFARKAGGYEPGRIYEGDRELKEAIDLIGSGFFSPGDPGLFRPLVDALLNRDEYLVLADYRSYVAAQEAAGRAYADPERWTAMSILNVARMGTFSSDRSIREYAEQIWRVTPLA